ncbi:MAG: hypothetical protein HND52_15030 [Ignavibacteriae bacterium]|nr:hypothetical protein [Ignavibacteriota bacterium]NOG99268.1 hypothetical protein [Ignavibacteriota bacterium]
MNKLLTENSFAEEVIGRAKTVLVSNEGPAIITSIIVRPIEDNISARLVFTGSVKFDEKLIKHLDEIILSHVNEILMMMDLPIHSFDISAQNIGAVSSNDSEFVVQGYSADVPIFLAMLSAGLQLPINQSSLFTGHISSNEGDISQVKSLVEKSEAAEIEKSIIEFVYPSLNNDTSLKVLKPKEYERTVSALRSCRGKIKLVEVDDTYELIKKTFSDESICLSSLISNYFGKNFAEIDKGKLTSIINYLHSENKNRFWKSLEENLLSKRVARSHSLLNNYLDYFLRTKKYPESFGIDLTNLIMSLPLTSKKTAGLFPIVPHDKYIQLIQYADESDYEDISFLHDIVFERVKTKNINIDLKATDLIKNNISSEIIDYILEKLDPNYIDAKILKPIDESRTTYIFDKINTASYDAFIESITNFYIHIVRHTNSESVKAEREKYSIEVLDLMKKIYPQKADYNSAITNGMNGYNGGLRIIFDKITEYLKQTSKDKYILATINEVVDPLNYEIKKTLVEEIIKRDGSQLDIDKSLLIPEKYVENYIQIIQAYAHSKHMLNNIFTRL